MGISVIILSIVSGLHYRNNARIENGVHYMQKNKVSYDNKE